jgi:hypothetical protein
MTTRTNIRTRKIGSNASSDKYYIPTVVETQFQDLALFIAHTGFVHIRTTRKKCDLDVIPIFHSVRDISYFRSNRYLIETEIACGLAFQSLDVAWRIVSQQTMAPGNELWYIIEENRFILYIQNGVSKGTLCVLSDEDEDPSLQSPFHVTFRPDPITISIDAFVSSYIIRTGHEGTSLYLCNALSIMLPHYMKRHGLSRSSIVNRLAKLRLEISTQPCDK